ncbi:uncharacterized protein V1516DRAFT_666969 [Lipomyces oligophaga]|uniref:uncharacterized protein n=1 Tax=Lipomyces oligophaga TaxID=45792 RepID=UPI0034CEB4DE
MSPRKKQKLNDSKSKGNSTLDFYIKKPVPTIIESGTQNDCTGSSIQDSDETFARQLQEQFDAEVQESTISEPDISLTASKAPFAKQLLVDSSIDEVVRKIDWKQEPHLFPLVACVSQLSSNTRSDAPYALLASLYVYLDSTRSRILMINALTNYLRTVSMLDPPSLIPSIWLCTNSLGPPYDNPELGIGWSALSRAIRNVSGVMPATLKSLYERTGDLGDAAFEAKVNVRTLIDPPRLRTSEVYTTLLRISAAKGSGSQEIKTKLVEKLLIRARGEEVRYLVRTLSQNLRVGVVRTSMIIALSRAFLYKFPSEGDSTPLLQIARQDLVNAEETLKNIYACHPDYAAIATGLLGTYDLSQVESLCPLTLHVPLLPMLGLIIRDVSEAIGKLKDIAAASKVANTTVRFACEYKYDGQRAQIHFNNTDGSNKPKISIFSRNLENMTDKYPDVVGLFNHNLGTSIYRSSEVPTSFIIDGELVAIDPGNGKILPFQTLANRARKDVSLGNISVSVCLYVFDLMFYNGRSLLRESFSSRRELLYSTFSEREHEFAFAQHLDCNLSTSDSDSLDQTKISSFFADSIAFSCEGLMLKLLDPPLATYYSPSTTRTHSTWYKLKKDYAASSDSLDLVPIGAWPGNGRKAQFWSPILLAARSTSFDYAEDNEDSTDQLVAVCKCMSGFSDLVYKDMKARYSLDEGSAIKSTTSDGLPVRLKGIQSGIVPEVWFRPTEVWEIKFADITKSPVYTAASAHLNAEFEDPPPTLRTVAAGLSIRFPRFIGIRTDKSIQDASSETDIARLYDIQSQRGPSAAQPEELPNDNEIDHQAE